MCPCYCATTMDAFTQQQMQPLLTIWPQAASWARPSSAGPMHPGFGPKLEELVLGALNLLALQCHHALVSSCADELLILEGVWIDPAFLACQPCACRRCSGTTRGWVYAPAYGQGCVQQLRIEGREGRPLRHGA